MKKRSLLFTVLASLSYTSSAFAGPYTDALSKCIVEKTTEEDKINLVQWMFSAMSLHPALTSFSSVSENTRTNSNKAIAALMTDLLTESCGAETKTAMKNEGPTAIQVSFTMLGQVAARELMAHPKVTAGMADLEKHFDAEKMAKAFATE